MPFLEHRQPDCSRGETGELVLEHSLISRPPSKPRMRLTKAEGWPRSRCRASLGAALRRSDGPELAAAGPQGRADIDVLAGGRIGDAAGFDFKGGNSLFALSIAARRRRDRGKVGRSGRGPNAENKIWRSSDVKLESGLLPPARSPASKYRRGAIGRALIFHGRTLLVPRALSIGKPPVAALPCCQQFGNSWHVAARIFMPLYPSHGTWRAISDGLCKKSLGGGFVLHGQSLEQFMRGRRKITGDLLFPLAGGGVEAPDGEFFGPCAAGLLVGARLGRRCRLSLHRTGAWSLRGWGVYS